MSIDQAYSHAVQGVSTCLSVRHLLWRRVKRFRLRESIKCGSFLLYAFLICDSYSSLSFSPLSQMTTSNAPLIIPNPLQHLVQTPSGLLVPLFFFLGHYTQHISWDKWDVQNGPYCILLQIKMHNYISCFLPAPFYAPRSRFNSY